MAVYLGSHQVQVNGGASSASVYTGAYEVTPSASDEQVLSTTNKLLTQDVTVHTVPYYETSNLTGETVYIASEV